MHIPPRIDLETRLTVRKLITSTVLSPTLLQIYYIGLIGPISYNWRCLWGELVLVRIITVMTGLGPHQTSLPHVESANIHQQGELHNLEYGNHVDN